MNNFLENKNLPKINITVTIISLIIFTLFYLTSILYSNKKDYLELSVS